MNKYKFNVIKVPLSTEEKRARAEEYNMFDAADGEEINVEEFIKQDLYEEYIQLKCLNCDYEEKVEADIILECFNFSKDAYPISYCPKCNKPKQVPIDIYNQIKKKKILIDA